MKDIYFFGEDKNLEFKREIPNNHENFLKDVIAFSNSAGGKIILGIEDGTGEVYGIGDKNPFKLSDAVSNMISDACTPQIEPDISIRTVEDKTVLVIDIAPGKFRPYYLRSKGKEATTFIRINGTSRPADGRKLRELEMEGENISYDSLQAIGMDFDKEKTMQLCNSMKEIAINSCTTEEEKNAIKDMTIEKLEDFGILCRVGRNIYPTHAFDLLTENSNKAAKIQCALFKGTVRDIFIDKKEFTGPIYRQVEDACQFVLRHINTGAVVEGIYRNDHYEVPLSAVREMIANAVVHRSYLDRSCIQVCIFDDRIEVLSPGMLYGGLDIETAKSGKSTCRNEAIAEAFHYMHIVEAWGTGIPRILSRCREYGLAEPEFEEIGDGFRVTIFRKTTNAQQKVTNGDENKTNAQQKVTNGDENKTNAQQKITNDFEQYASILEEAHVKVRYIESIGVIFAFNGTDAVFGQKDVMSCLKCSQSKARNIINAMKAAGIIEKVTGFGPGKYKFIEFED